MINFFKKALIFVHLITHCEYDLNVIYDSQDNIVKINGGEWEQSWDIDTWNNGVNNKISVHHLWDTNQLEIWTNEFVDIISVEVNGDLLPVTNIGNKYFVTYPQMHSWMDNSDIFKLKIKALK